MQKYRIGEAVEIEMLGEWCQGVVTAIWPEQGVDAEPAYEITISDPLAWPVSRTERDIR